MIMLQNQVETQIQEVARRIRAAREGMGYSIELMAEKTDVTPEEYSNLEQGLTDFSFTFIYKFAQACNLEIADLMEGHSPSLANYNVTRKGDGMKIVRRKGFEYYNLAPMFKNKLSEPFRVVIPYSEDAVNQPMHLASHEGQEFDVVLKGCMKIQLGDRSEILYEGDSIYYDSSTPHDEIAIGGTDCEIYAVVINPDSSSTHDTYHEKVTTMTTTNVDLAHLNNPIYERYISTTLDENGVLAGISYKNTDDFNFAFDIVDELAKKCPNKTAMFYLSNDKEERTFTFADISRYSNQTANYFRSLGIKKGDRVMLVLKRHYQFWFSILALHKIGAVVIPASNQLMTHDFDYRFNTAQVSAIVCTADGETAAQVEQAALNSPSLKTMVLVNGKRDGWHTFNEEFGSFSDTFEKPSREDGGYGDDTMLMFFTSGTTGYPKIVAHSFKYPLGHFITAKYWHNVDPNGLHLTIADTGWGKALWGKLYGQWLCEAGVFVYDFNKFDADDILSTIQKYPITTFCAPPTMYRFFIKTDMSKYDLSSLKYATVAGEALNPEIYSQFFKYTGLRLMEGFGQTETALSVGNFVGTTIKPGSMGKPSPLYDIDLVTPDGTPAKVGEIGEVVVHTENGVPFGLFKGYYLDNEKTKEVWSDNLYHTGDTAYRDEDGYYWYVGRTDDLIKSSGYRIGPFEIESVIMELPYVLECAVTGVPDKIRGNVVKASIVLTPGTVGTDELKKEIQTYVKKNTAPYKYPRIVDFLDELPKTVGSGKIRRVDLR